MDEQIINVQPQRPAGNTPVIKGLDIGVHDHITLTYVAAGNGAGEIETVVYRRGGSGGNVLATLTLAYDASNNLSTVTQS